MRHWRWSFVHNVEYEKTNRIGFSLEIKKSGLAVKCPSAFCMILGVGTTEKELLEVEPSFIYNDFEEVWESEKRIFIETDVETNTVTTFFLANSKYPCCSYLQQTCANIFPSMPVTAASIF